MATIQPSTASAGNAQWQPDLFSRARRGPMRALWRDDAAEDFGRWARRLQRSARLIMHGSGETNGPLVGDWSIGLYFRCSPSLHVCALCVQDEATIDWQPPARRGPPAPYLMYIYPTSNDPQTLVRWLMAEYLATDTRQIADAEVIEAQGDFDLTGIVDDWD